MDQERYDQGMAIRHEMWGRAGGEDKVAGASDFLRDFEEQVVTEFCFGTAWARPGLTRAERSMATLSMLIALGRSPEIGVHVEGAVATGVTREQIRELCFHSSVYCGIPAAVDAFRTAEPILDRLGAA